MPITYRDGFAYGAGRDALREQLVRALRGGRLVHFVEARCGCGSERFQVEVDEDAGTVRARCASCGATRSAGIDAPPAHPGEQCECICGETNLELTVAHDGDRQDVGSLAVGCRCARCSLVACYAVVQLPAGTGIDDVLSPS
jgi:hypothetical protein